MISLLLPSRGRPANLRRLHESAWSRSEALGWEMVVRLDEDDPTRDAYPVLPNVRYLTGERGVLSEMWNECWREAEGPVFGLLGDDVVFRSGSWDYLVEGAFPSDGIAYVHGDDLGGKGDRLGTHGFVRREWTDLAGFLPAVFSSDYSDLWLNDIADRVGRRVFLPGLVMEHMHPGFGKAEDDRTYRETSERGRRDGVERIWEDSTPQRDALARMLRRAIGAPLCEGGAGCPNEATRTEFRYDEEACEVAVCADHAER